jgi:hypothetical protein
MAPPYSIETTYPASSNLISQFPEHETTFRQTVSDWLSGLSDATTGKLNFASFPSALPVANGGTGVTSIAAYKTALSLGALADKDQAALATDVTGTLAVGNGGTGVTSIPALQTALGLGSAAYTASSAYATAAQGVLATNAMPKTGGTFTGAVAFNSTVWVPQNLFSSTINLVMGPTGAGTVYLRPNGPGDGTGQFYVTASGATVCSGTFATSGTISAPQVTYTSDERLKSSITPISDAVKKVQKLSGYLYHREDLDAESAGLIAQEVQRVLPEAVRSDDDGMLSIDPGAVIGLLVQAVKELSYGPAV